MKQSLYKNILRFTKISPFIISIFTIISLVIDYYKLPIFIVDMLSYFSLLLIVYLMSYLLGFCNYHRNLIQYVFTIYALNGIDVSIGLPINNDMMFGLYGIITSVYLIIVIYNVINNKTRITKDH